jgi:hypothetical protein
VRVGRHLLQGYTHGDVHRRAPDNRRSLLAETVNVTRPYVRLCILPGGRVVGLQPGDLIGRSRAAALRLNSPRISEAHALVSLREGQLKLLALRGRIARRGEAPVSELVLSPGLEVKLARGLSLQVQAVSLPMCVLALRLGGVEVALVAPEYSLTSAPLALSPGFHAGARGYIWSGDERWFLQLGDQPVQPLEEGAGVEIDGERLEVTTLPLAALAASRTVGVAQPVSAEPGLRLEVHLEATLLYREAQLLARLSGNSARLVHALAELHPDPRHWAELAREVWNHGRQYPRCEEQAYRNRFHATLRRLRQHLAERGVREDLVGQASHGGWRLNLAPEDQLIVHDVEGDELH